MKVLLPAELKALLDSGGSVSLLDVRQPEELEHGTFEGALCIPMSEIQERLEEVREHFEQSKNRVVYCRSGGRSERVIQFLESKGFSDLINLTGGTNAYSELDPRFKKY